MFVQCIEVLYIRIYIVFLTFVILIGFLYVCMVICLCIVCFVLCGPQED